MKTKKSATKLQLPAVRSRQPGFAEDAVEAYVAERADELNASIKRARAEVKKGIHSTRSVKDIAVAGAKRLRDIKRVTR